MAEIATLAISTAFSAAQQHAAGKQQAAKVEAQRRQQVTQLQQQQEIETRRRREQLRQAQAAQRARFAGGGISAASGSASSLLSGMARQVDQAIADSRNSSATQIDAINSSAAAQRSSLLSQGRGALLGGFQSALNLGASQLPSLFK